MGEMTCVNHKQAQFMCINVDCTTKCAYICSNPGDVCRQNHESCPLVNLTFLMRTCSKMLVKDKQINMDKLIALNTVGFTLFTEINKLVQTSTNISKIRGFLDAHGLLEAKDKEIVSNLVSSKAIKDPEIQFSSLEKELSALNLAINDYLVELKINRKRMEEQATQRKRSKQVIESQTSPVHSSIKESRQIKSRSKVQPNNSLQFEEVLVAPLRKHLPYGPLYSHITNEADTITAFFYHKFVQAILLYRASQNGFLVSKFHECCNQVCNTLTLVLTQSGKAIGGFTPLPWKSGGGEWYEDETASSFLFSLSSGERYPLQVKEKAIWCSNAFGPSFGHPDLEIADKAHSNANSCANFPQCYNNGNYIKGSGSTEIFSGSKNGHFRIKEWEVYQLIF